MLIRRALALYVDKAAKLAYHPLTARLERRRIGAEEALLI
jgi:hypothetical protein